MHPGKDIAVLPWHSIYRTTRSGFLLEKNSPTSCLFHSKENEWNRRMWQCMRSIPLPDQGQCWELVSDTHGIGSNCDSPIQDCIPEWPSGTRTPKEKVPNCFCKSLCLGIGGETCTSGDRSSHTKYNYLSFGLTGSDICGHELAVSQVRPIENAGRRAAGLVPESHFQSSL